MEKSVAVNLYRVDYNVVAEYGNSQELYKIRVARDIDRAVYTFRIMKNYEDGYKTVFEFDSVKEFGSADECYNVGVEVIEEIMKLQATYKEMYPNG